MVVPVVEVELLEIAAMPQVVLVILLRLRHRKETMVALEGQVTLHHIEAAVAAEQVLLVLVPQQAEMAVMVLHHLSQVHL
jgi:hypothetical protein